MRILPVNRKSFIHLHVLAGFDAIGRKECIVAGRSGRRDSNDPLRKAWNEMESADVRCPANLFRVVNGAVSVVVVAHGAVENWLVRMRSNASRCAAPAFLIL